MSQSWLSRSRAPDPPPARVLRICLHFGPSLGCRSWAPSHPLFWNWTAAPTQSHFTGSPSHAQASPSASGHLPVNGVSLKN